MKKHSYRYRRWLIYRATKSHRANIRRTSSDTSIRNVHSIVTVWDGKTWKNVICKKEPTHPPTILSLRKNPAETLDFFSKFREHCLEPISKTKKNRKQRKRIDRYISRGWLKLNQDNNIPNIRTYYDFSQINEMGTSAALILTAEYDRLSKIINAVPVTINLHEWSDSVFNKLYELGFFEILKLTSDVRDRYKDDGPVRTMRILSGSNAEDIEIASKQLTELCRFIDPNLELNQEQSIALNTAVSEGMINVARHAYAPAHAADFKHQHVKSWWLTASANKDTRKLVVVLFDQGVSIPVTLPKQPKWKEVLSNIRSRVTGPNDDTPYEHDGRYIQTALDLGETSTKEPGRGLGLPQMKELIDTFQLGSLTIWSRGGMCRYTATGLENVNAHICSVGGTLVEWIIELPSLVQNE